MDDDPIDQLLGTAAARLAAYGYVLTGSRAAGDELVRAAIVKVFVRHRWLRDVRAAEGHVRVAMRTIHLAEVRRATTWRAHVPWPRAHAIHGDEAPTVDSRDPMTRALASLPPQQRAAVVLRHYDQLMVAEIADAMGVEVDAVERYLAQARETLSHILGDIEPEYDQVLIVDTSRR